MSDFLKQTLLLSLCLFAFISCKNTPKAEAVQPAAKPDTIRVTPISTEGASTFTITEGIVTWSGTKTLKKDGHQGTIAVEGGELMVNQGQLIKGKVILDMNSLSVSDIKDPGERRDLESHLKDADFFEVEKYPKAEFVIEEVLPNNLPGYNWVLSGQLTMKDKTLPVNIPVKVSIVGDVLQAESASFPINRTQWGISFHSGVLGTAKDKMIDDMVPLILRITAQKK